MSCSLYWVGFVSCKIWSIIIHNTVCFWCVQWENQCNDANKMHSLIFNSPIDSAINCFSGLGVIFILSTIDLMGLNVVFAVTEAGMCHLLLFAVDISLKERHRNTQNNACIDFCICTTMIISVLLPIQCRRIVKPPNVLLNCDI